VKSVIYYFTGTGNTLYHHPDVSIKDMRDQRGE